tara:strand:- start:2992 stop:4284 length:1293 start_codon:yes stop_codon:yes gene_type:complete
MSAHAKLMQPSGSKKWLNCAMAPVHEQSIGDTTENVPADQGTVAHYLGELRLTCNFDVASLLDGRAQVNNHGDVQILDRDAKPVSGRTVHRIDSDMIWHVNNYAQNVWDYQEAVPDSVLWVERRMRLNKVTGEDAGGTSDIVVTSKRMLQIHDLKYGFINVYPKENAQLSIYALAAAYLEGYITVNDTGSQVVRDRDVLLVIHQPRDFRVSEWATTLRELVDWQDAVVRPAAERVLTANKSYAEGKDVSEYYKAGGHCQYCKHNLECVTFLNHVNASAAKVADSVGITVSDTLVTDLVSFHKLAGTLKTISNKVEAKLLTMALEGCDVPGFKLVNGREGNRAWIDLTDDELSGKLIEMGITPDQIFKTSVVPPSGISKLVKEKAITKEVLKSIESELMTRSEAKPKLVAIENDSLAYVPKDLTEGFVDES